MQRLPEDVRVDRAVLLDHAGHVESFDRRRADRSAVESVGVVDGIDGCLEGVDEEPGRTVLDQFGHRAPSVGDDRSAARHGLDDAVAERFVEVDQVEQGVGAPQNGGAFGRGDRAEEPDVVSEVGLDFSTEVVLVLDDPGDVESAPGTAGDLDRRRGALVGMDPPEVQQMIAGRRCDVEVGCVDAVVDGCGVVEARVAVRRR